MSSVFENPPVTPRTMLAISVRVRPCSCLLRFSSLGRCTFTDPFSTETSIGSAQRSFSSPLGPLTVTTRSLTPTFTPDGTAIGIRPILLICALPDERHDFTAAAKPLGLPAADDALRRRKNDEPEAAHALGDLAFGRVDAQARAADALQPVDDALAACAVF